MDNTNVRNIPIQCTDSLEEERVELYTKRDMTIEDYAYELDVVRYYKSLETAANRCLTAELSKKVTSMSRAVQTDPDTSTTHPSWILDCERITNLLYVGIGNAINDIHYPSTKAQGSMKYFAHENGNLRTKFKRDARHPTFSEIGNEREIQSSKKFKENLENVMTLASKLKDVIPYLKDPSITPRTTTVEDMYKQVKHLGDNDKNTQNLVSFNTASASLNSKHSLDDLKKRLLRISQSCYQDNKLNEDSEVSASSISKQSNEINKYNLNIESDRNKVTFRFIKQKDNYKNPYINEGIKGLTYLISEQSDVASSKCLPHFDSSASIKKSLDNYDNLNECYTRIKASLSAIMGNPINESHIIADDKRKDIENQDRNIEKEVEYNNRDILVDNKAATTSTAHSSRTKSDAFLNKRKSSLVNGKPKISTDSKFKILAGREVSLNCQLKQNNVEQNDVKHLIGQIPEAKTAGPSIVTAQNDFKSNKKIPKQDHNCKNFIKRNILAFKSTENIAAANGIQQDSKVSASGGFQWQKKGPSRENRNVLP